MNSDILIGKLLVTLGTKVYCVFGEIFIQTLSHSKSMFLR